MTSLCIQKREEGQEVTDQDAFPPPPRPPAPHWGKEGGNQGWGAAAVSHLVRGAKHIKRAADKKSQPHGGVPYEGESAQTAEEGKTRTSHTYLPAGEESGSELLHVFGEPS